MSEGSPTVRRRRLGMELRRLREAMEMTGEEAAKVLDCSPSKISKVENGKAVLKAVEVRALLETYGVTDPAAYMPLLDIARQARQKSWWDTFDDVLPAGFETYVGLEAEATSLRAYDPQLVHGLLQTPDYSRAVIRAIRPGEGSDTIDRLVELRARRQEVLDRASATCGLRLWVILDEAVLCRPIGGPAVMRAQLRRLMEANDLPNITLQVLPFSKGVHPGLTGRFAIIGFSELSDLDVVYVDSPAGNLYLEKPRDLRRYADRFNLLMSDALPVDESAAKITSAMKELL